jgi:hypothetical protein
MPGIQGKSQIQAHNILTPKLNQLGEAIPFKNDSVIRQ